MPFVRWSSGVALRTVQRRDRRCLSGLCLTQCGRAEVRFTTSARKHRIGKTRALQAMIDAGEPDVIPGTGDLDDRLLLVGRDEKGVELEVIAIEQPDHLLVIHVMPYAYRRKPR